MKTYRTLRRRQSMLVAATSALFGWLSWPFARIASAQKATLLAKQVNQVPDDPEDPRWGSADTLEVPLAPQVVVKPRVYEAGVKGVTARALYDKGRLAFLLEWGDAERDVSIGGVDSFRDAIAIQFPSAAASSIPYFGMGELNKSVTIYHWKADWQLARDHDVDEEFPNMAADWYPFSGRDPGEIAQASDYGKEGAEKAFHTSWWAGSTLADPVLQAKTPLEKLTAEGFGTVRPVDVENQDGFGKGVWRDGVWKTVISIPRTQEQFSFERGKVIPVAFAAWDGARQERGGEKAISTWYFLGLEQPVSPFAYISPVLVAVGAGIAQIVGLRMLRGKTRQSEQENP